VDTAKAEVAAAALEAGAVIVNDVTGLGDPAMAPLVAATGAGLVLMHMKGSPRTMQDAPRYDDVVREVCGHLASRRETAEGAGIPRDRIVLDPGIGFGKTVAHNLELLTHLGAVAALGSPVLVGVSRKRFIGALTGVSDPGHRLAGTLGAVLAARLGGAGIFRVHDVAAAGQALAVFDALVPRRAPHALTPAS
jgi:dihydropteroate synthase